MRPIEGGGSVRSRTPTPAAWAGGSTGGGGGSFFFRFWGHFRVPRFVRSILNTHKSCCTIHCTGHGKSGGEGFCAPVHRGLRSVPGAQVGRSSLFAVGVGWGVLRRGGGGLWLWLLVLKPLLDVAAKKGTVGVV